MAVEFSDLTTAEKYRFATLLSNKASQIVNGLRRIEQYKTDAQKPTLILTQEEVDGMVQKMETELLAGIAYVAAIPVTPESAREAEANINNQTE